MKVDNLIKQRLLAKAARTGLPVMGTFELTPRCNLQCKMCYVRLTEAEMRPLGRELSAKKWLSLAREAVDAGMVFLLLTGGEPLLRQDFCEIYEGLAAMGISVSINTNAVLLRGTVRELMKKYPPAHVNITLYGTSRETYGALCGNPDAYDSVMDALHWLKDNGILVNLNATLTPQNKDDWAAIKAFAERGQLNFRPTMYAFPPARRSNAAAFTRLSPQEVGAMLAQNELARHGCAGLDAWLASLDSSPLADDRILAEGEPMRCYAGRSQFWVTWNGEMTACGMLDTPKADPFRQGFVPAWNALREAVGSIRLCADCAVCPHRKLCSTCAAVTYAETGRFDGKPEYMCRMVDAFIDELRAASAAPEKQP